VVSAVGGASHSRPVGAAAPGGRGAGGGSPPRRVASHFPRAWFMETEGAPGGGAAGPRGGGAPGPRAVPPWAPPPPSGGGGGENRGSRTGGVLLRFFLRRRGGCARCIEPVRAPPGVSMAAPRNGVEVRVQCFDALALRRVHEATGLWCSLGVAAGADWRALFREHGGWLSGLVASKGLLPGFGGHDSGLVEAAPKRSDVETPRIGR